MQELDEILEEINQEKMKHWDSSERLETDKLIRWCFDKCTAIIRKHMTDDPDGWIPVDERLPEDEIPVPKLVTALVPDRKARWDNSETFSLIVDTDVYDPDYMGKWEYYKKNVIAWRSLPEPYRPEGSDCDGK